MVKKKHRNIHHFSDLLDEQIVAAAFVVIALMALIFTILDFSTSISL